MSATNKIKMSSAEWHASISLAGVYSLRMLGMFLVLPVLALHAHGLIHDQTDGIKLVGLTMAMYGLTQAVLQLPLGILSDKIGRKKVIYIGMGIFAIGSFLGAYAHDIHTLMIARAIQGAGAVSAAVTALLADLTREEVRTRSMSMIGLSIGLTFSVSLVLSPLLTQFVGVTGIFELMGVLSLMSLLVVRFFTPNPQQSKLHEDVEMQPKRIGEVLRNTQLLRLNYGIFALQTCLMAIFTVLPFALRDLGWEKFEHWKIYLPATVIGLILMIPAIVIGETRNKLKHVLVMGIALVLAAQIALWFSLHAIWWVCLCLIIYFIGFNILEASIPSLVSKIAPSDLKGTAMGVYNTLQSLGVFTGGMIGGKMYDIAGFGGVFGFCCAIVLLWLIIAILAPAPKPVKNVIMAVPEHYRSQLEQLSGCLKQVAGVEDVIFSRDGETVFIKAQQKGFDEVAAQRVLTGN